MTLKLLRMATNAYSTTPTSEYQLNEFGQHATFVDTGARPVSLIPRPNSLSVFGNPPLAPSSVRSRFVENGSSAGMERPGSWAWHKPWAISFYYESYGTPAPGDRYTVFSGYDGTDGIEFYVDAVAGRMRYVKGSPATVTEIPTSPPVNYSNGDIYGVGIRYRSGTLYTYTNGVQVSASAATMPSTSAASVVFLNKQVLAVTAFHGIDRIRMYAYDPGAERMITDTST